LMDDDAEEVLRFLEKKNSWRKELMVELRISNHPLDKALRGLRTEGLIRRLTEQEQPKAIQRPRGHPTVLYALTEKGHEHVKQLDASEELRKQKERLMERLWQEYDRGSISFGELCAKIQTEQQRFIKVPTRQEILEAFAECVEALQSNTLMLIETGDEKHPNDASMTILSKEDFKLKTFKVKKGKGVAPSYSIEPVAGLTLEDIPWSNPDLGRCALTLGFPMRKAVGGPRQSKKHKV